MIQYLVKFFSKETYADDLLNGKLFMHCAQYYHNLEIKNGPGQGDLREGAIFPNVAIYMNINFPIYCMYMIKDEDIKFGKVTLDKRLINDFSCEQGVMVIVPFNHFEKVILSACTEGYTMCGGEVQYGIPTQEDVKLLINSKDALNLLVKHPYFNYQKEYRLIVYKNIKASLEQSYVCRLLEPISKWSKKVSISTLKETKEGLEINLIDLFKED